jgi:NTP pyrophosphatase (non-canonical NTP hydrolase)
MFIRKEREVKMEQYKSLTFAEYQQLAQRTANTKLDWEKRLSAAGLGVCGEAGEVADHIKKYIAHGHKLDREKIIKEIGDVLWYLSEISTLLEENLSDVAYKNYEKLAKRYPEGFSEERSIHRENE